MNQKPNNRHNIATDVLDNLPGLVFRVINDGVWTFAYASNGSIPLLGYKPNELVDIRNLRKMIPEGDVVTNRKILSKVSPDNPHYKVIFRIRSHTGDIKWVREEGTGFFAPNGKMLHLDGFLVDVTEYKEREQELVAENHILKSSIQHRQQLDGLIGESRAMLKMCDMIIKASNSHATVVVTGESGTGKELASRAIHNLCDNSNKPFIAVNCGAISPNLVESEFFGYRKGAFSGADTNRQGLLSAAKGGTLFLDEIGEIPLSLQIKLLRVLDDGSYTPVGDTVVKQADFRLIVATNRNLEELVRTGNMREDFYYRINAIRIHTPPLRDRDADILRLAGHFIEKYCQADPLPQFSDAEKAMLLRYNWPGNIRELQNVISRYLIHGKLDLSGEMLTQQESVSKDSLRQRSSTNDNFASNLKETEKQMILDVLESNHWHVGKSAAQLGISRRTMYRRLKKYNLSR